MALSKVTANGITDNAVTTAKIASGAVEEVILLVTQSQVQKLMMARLRLQI